jgi:Do/DeqQ family serine protease
MIRPRFTLLLLASALAVSALPASAQYVPASQAQISLSFAPVVKKASPSVVNIYTKRVVRERVSVSPFLNDPVFGQLFGNSSPLLQGPVRERVERSLGSGVIIGGDGLIVTSHHVIKNAQAIIVAMADKREFEATVVKRDPQTDLAFLKIDAKETLPYLEMRDSDTLEVGELVLAIGNPFNVGQTVTQGIISALARPAAGVSDYQFFIQTDAAINPGNSGGALVDMAGRLIGINTAIFSTSGGSNGIGFAIPTATVRAVQSSQVKEGQVVRPWFGIASQPITREIADSLGLKSPTVALVRKVTENSPAAKAGIMEGDVITSLNGYAIDSDKSLAYRIGTTSIGQPADVIATRKGTELKFTVLPSAPPQVANDSKMLKGTHPLAGLTVSSITPDIAAELGMEVDDAKGVVIIGGQNVGGVSLSKGDIIAEVNGQPVTSVSQLEKALSAKTRTWKILALRGGSTLTLTIRQ